MEGHNYALVNKLADLSVKLWEAGIIKYDLDYQFILEYSIKEKIKNKTWKKIHYSPN